MAEAAVTASDLRDKLAEYLDGIEGGRVLVTKHGRERAYLISVKEIRALEETLAILENQDLIESIDRGLRDLREGRVEDARDAFAELDAEFRQEGKSSS